MPRNRVRFIGSRELHRDLPKVLESLEDPNARCVLTIHSKPRAVLLGTEAFMALLEKLAPADRLLALQLGALVQGHEAGTTPENDTDAVTAEAPPRRRAELVGV